MLLKPLAENRTKARERFSDPLVSFGIVLLFLLLLYALFPDKLILETMGRVPARSPLVLSYREALLHKRPTDMDLRLKLAEGLAESSRFGRALKVLDGHGGSWGGNREGYLKVRYRALKGLLSVGAVPLAEKTHLTGDLFRVARELDSLAPGFVASEKSNVAAAASAPQSYRDKARGFFRSMKEADSVAKRRALFMKGVRTLQAGNLPVEALTEGEANMAGLEPDRETLLFMTRVALAAGKPPAAQRFISRALGMARDRNQGGGV